MTYPQAATPKKPIKRKVIGAVIVVGVIVVGGLVAQSVVSQSSPGERAGGHCEEMVTEQMISPTSAQFSAVRTVRQPGDKWVTTGQVDSSNALGVMLRQEFTCRSELDEDGSLWTKIVKLD